MKITSQNYLLELKRPFVIAHGARTHQPTLIVCIHKDGIEGYGEASAIHYYGITVEGMQQKLHDLLPELEKISWETPQELYPYLLKLLPQDPFLRCTLDVAAYDWYAKRCQKPLYQVLGYEAQEIPWTNFTISYGALEQMIQEMRDHPFPVYKVKLTSSQDILLLEKILADTSIPIRVDANTAWDLSSMKKFKSILEHPQIEFIEQPLSKDNWPDMKEAFECIKTVFIADESVQYIDDIDYCVGKFHGINIKVMKCGGITPALKMIHKAKALSLKVMLGCMTESTVGISAICHLLSQVDYADVDGAYMVKNNPAQGVTIEQGKVYIPDIPGIGVVF